MNVKLTEIKNNGTPWLKIPADGSQITFTGNADEAAKEFFNALIRVRDGYISALKAERDALAQRVEILAQNLGNAIWGEQEALQRVNALAVENAALKSKAAELVHEASEVYSAYNATIREPDGDFMDMQTLYEMQRIETPATSAALAAIKKQAGIEAVEEAAYSLYGKGYIFDTIMGYATELREAK
ncbi:hypothetical protein GW643_13545 [Serratia marcescens]|uniref:hypothetical protein n=1 Tax=Serratia marcescens TaxID=615 RepID=UPI001378464C|nr:hypothetical protein [Serratia marcescens]NCJ11413.1 hypothetical protein [Serratia marcescens]NDJ01508.1 hypothetical protein [Serratia marcescens]HEJ7024533.1 hypothetical protein [Serratia marcescens]